MSVASRRSKYMHIKKAQILFLLLFAVIAVAIAPGQARAQIPTPVPTFTPMPTNTPQPIATPRLFHCNCSGPGKPVAWAGFVQAPNYFQASQAAGGQCSAALAGIPVSPQIPTSGGLAQPTPVPLILSPCTSCACN